MKLSIGRAWDETKRILAADGGAIFTIAFALMVLPAAILETISPSTLRPDDNSLWLSFVGLLTALLSLSAQLAISRIALGPATTVGGALKLGFRRLPFLFGALMAVVLPFALMVAALAMTQGDEFNPRALPPILALAVVIVLIAAFAVFVRLLLLTPTAADTNLRPLALVRQAWRLSRGSAGKLLLLVLLLMFVAAVLIGGLGGALSAVAILALGELAPGSLSAVVVALIQQTLGAIVSVLFVLVVCRLYAQARGGEAVASVPDAGGA